MQYRQKFAVQVLILITALNCFSQPPAPNVNEVYQKAMAFYRLKDYKNSASEFDKIYPAHLARITNSNYLYDGACIYALNNEKQKAFELLNILTFEKYYFNLNHITSDADLVNLYNEPQWKTIIERVKENVKTLPERTKGVVKEKLTEAKQILEKDGGKLWGEKIWSDDLLVLDFDNTVYSLSPFPGSKTDDSIIYYQNFPPDTFSFSNSVQDYKGKKYAVVMANYLSDNSATIIHELFHVLQFRHRRFQSFEVPYMDNYDAREWLRLEYQALRNCLTSINEKQGIKKTQMFLNDAMLYRKLRQTKYKEFLPRETELETLEGLANYTGYTLSTFPNKYEVAVRQINNREGSNTYSRPFVYATGLAYGLIFDYLKMNWKKGFDETYNFLDIYEKTNLERQLKVTGRKIAAANLRNNYAEIHKQELVRKEKTERLISLLRKEFIENPTLSVTLKNENYTQTTDMDNVTVLSDIGTVFKNISGWDSSAGKNFGKFKTLPNADELSGILRTFDGKSFIFPMPFKIEGNKITGKNYEIELAGNWTIRQKNEKGDYEIVEK